MKNNKLFELINSLNKTEKRHFSKFSNKNSSNSDLTYIKLYKEIDKMKFYDKVKLVEKFGATKLKTNSTYLYNQILVSLRVLHREDTRQRTLRNNIIDIHFLKGKQLYAQADLLVDKSLILADKVDDLFLKVTLIEFKLQLLKIPNKKINYYQKSLELKEMYESTLISINKKLTLGFYVGNFVHLIEKNFLVEDDSQLSIIPQFLDDEGFKKQDISLGSNAEYDRLSLLALIYNSKKDYENSFKYALQSYEFSKTITNNNNIEALIIKYGNVLAASIPVNNEIVFKEFIEKLKAIKLTLNNRTIKKQRLIDYNIITNTFHFFARNKQYKDVEKEYKVLLENFEILKRKDFNPIFNYEICLYNYIVEFNANKYNNTLSLINNCETAKEKDKINNKYETLFKSICLYKLGSEDVALDLLNAYIRKTKKNKDVFSNTISNFILNKITNKANTENKEILSEIDIKKFDVFEKSIFEWCTKN